MLEGYIDLLILCVKKIKIFNELLIVCIEIVGKRYNLLTLPAPNYW